MRPSTRLSRRCICASSATGGGSPSKSSCRPSARTARGSRPSSIRSGGVRASWKTPTARSRGGSSGRSTRSAPCSGPRTASEGAMSQVSVTINGRVYRMACDDGQEDYLVRLARELDLRIQQLRETFGEIGDTRLAVTAAIMLADEVSELRKRMRATEQEIESLHQEQLAGTEKADESERAFAAAIEEVAERIERLAHGLSGGGLREDTAVG